MMLIDQNITADKTVVWLLVTVCPKKYGSGHEGVMAALLPGFAIILQQNHVTWQPHFHDLAQMLTYGLAIVLLWL